MKRTTTAIIALVGILLAGSHHVRASQQEPSENTIVPGQRVGDYTLDMSKDEVLKKLGEPKVINYSGEHFRLNDLPTRYFIHFGDISFYIVDDSVNSIIVYSPLYKFANGLGVGDSEEKIKQAFGDDFRLRETLWKDILTYEDEGLTFEIRKKNRTVMEISVYQTTKDHGDSDTPDSRKVIMLSEQPPGPITFPKIDRKPKPNKLWEQREMKSLPKYNPDSTNPFQIDLRCRDLSKLDLSDSIDDLLYATFDDRTVWSASDKMPHNFTWQKFMELGENPGLGVRTLHKRGITGKGVGIAIIDQPLLTEHQEYADSLRLYEEIKVESHSKMHGAAVASIAVGKTVGVAPDADLYYIATWFCDYTKGDDAPLSFRYTAQSVRRLLEINRQLPADQKIRVLSISTGWHPPHDGYDEMTAACEEAKAAGIFVVSCSLEHVHGFKFQGLGRHPLVNPDVFESYEPGLWWAKEFHDGVRWRDSDRLVVPMDSRTTASPTGSDEYVFYRQGGWSWSIPYIAGVYALAVQVEPDITPERFWDLAIKTGRTIELEHKGERHSFGPIIDAVRLIGSIKAGELSNLNRKQSDNQQIRTRPQTYSETQTIVPGLRVGDYTLGMSKDDVLKKLGEPEKIFAGVEKYTLNNLPRMYGMFFGDISFGIDNDTVTEITARSPYYKFTNGLGVGDSEQKIKQAFGNDFNLREAVGKDYLTYDEGLEFEIHKKNRTVMEINVRKKIYRGHGDSLAKPIMLSEQSPGPITFPKIDRKPKPGRWGRGEMKSLPKYDPDSDNSFQVDLRGYDLSKLDLRNSIENLMYAAFDDRTVWPAPNQMPSDFNWQKFMELGKNPGLGIRSLHKKGITGRGVRVAIIDQPLLVDHQEYVERVRLYEEIDLQGETDPSMHGAAVASIAVGKTVGVAPEAELYYIAQYNFDRDKGTPTLRSLAKGIHRMLEINEQLPKDKKIRVISISKGWMRSHKDYKVITEAVQKARAAGMLVVCSGVELIHDGCGFGALGRSPLADPEVFESYEPGLFLAKAFRARRIFLPECHFWAPMDSRTTASPTGSDEYVFYRINGVSWTIPYIAGVYALAVQVDPAITPESFWALAVQTGRTIELNYNGKTMPLGPIIDPVRLIRSIKAGELSNKEIFD